MQIAAHYLHFWAFGCLIKNLLCMGSRAELSLSMVDDSLLNLAEDAPGCFAASGFHVKQLDVTDSTSVHKCIADTIKEHGRLDSLINNAGFGTQQNVEQVCGFCSSVCLHGVCISTTGADKASLQPCRVRGCPHSSQKRI